MARRGMQRSPHTRRDALATALVLAIGVVVVFSAFKYILAVQRGEPHVQQRDDRGAAGTRAGLQKPQHRFLVLFSGHQGSSALADMLGQLPEVFIPGFEPLDAPGLSPAQKLAFLEAVFTFPSSEAAFTQWRQDLVPTPHIRVNRTLVKGFDQLAGKTAAGFKLRPYPPMPGGGNQSHTAMTGMDRGAFRALLHKYNVSIVVTLRHNSVKEAISWYKARELGLQQFQAIGRDRRMGALGPGASTQQGRVQLQEPGGGSSSASWAPLPILSKAVAVNTTRLLNWLRYVDYTNQQLRDSVAYLQRPALLLYYEDFLADPVRVVGRAARFIGADPAPLRTSSKFSKQAPDALQAAVLNFGELCRALEHTQYFEFLELHSCPPISTSQAGTANGSAGGVGSVASGLPPARAALEGAGNAGVLPGAQSATAGSQPGDGGGGGNSSSCGAAGGAGGSSGQLPNVTLQPAVTQAREAPVLLRNWCYEHDKLATPGWEAVSGEECMRRMEESKAAAATRVREGRGFLLFKHVHKAGGTTLCQLAQGNMVAESAKLPNRDDWDTNCVPYEAFLGPHPAVGLARRLGGGTATGAGGGAKVPRMQQQQGMVHQDPPRKQEKEEEEDVDEEKKAAEPEGHSRSVLGAKADTGEGTAQVEQRWQLHSTAGAAGSSAAILPFAAATGSADSAGASSGAGMGGSSGTELRHRGRQLQAVPWLGGACWLGFLTPAQLRVLPHHYRPLTFVASEGPLPDALPLDLPFAMVTMLRHPLDRVLSSYRWWRLMESRMPASPAECRAYAAPPNATLEAWLDAYPDNWVTRELGGASLLYVAAGAGGEGRRQLPALGAMNLLAAKQRLHYFAAVLIMERWEDAANVLRDVFGWADVDFHAHRAGSKWNSAAEQELKPAVLNKLRALNELDMELYEYAVALVASRNIAL